MSSSSCPSRTGSLEERPAPDRLTSHTVTLLDVYGSLFYAGARTLQAHLPEVGASHTAGRGAAPPGPDHARRNGVQGVQ